MNIRVPHVTDKAVLDTLGSGIWVILEQHKKLGLDFTEFSVMENAKLTMGDHAADLCDGTDESFDSIYQPANKCLNDVLAANWSDIENFADRLTDIKDIMIFSYDGLIRLCVNEKGRYGC